MSTRQLSNEKKIQFHIQRGEQYMYWYLESISIRQRPNKKATKNNPIKRTLAVLLYTAGLSVMCLDLCHFWRYVTVHQYRA